MIRYIFYAVLKSALLLSFNVLIAYVGLHIVFGLSLSRVTILWLLLWIFGVVKPLGLMEGHLFRRKKCTDHTARVG